MGKREKKKEKVDPEDEEEIQKSVILLSSSDDEEANEDLSLKIVEKARIREAKRKRKTGFDEFEAFVVDLSSSSCEEIEGIAARPGAKNDEKAAPKMVGEEVKKKKKKKKKNKIIEEEEKTINAVKPDEQLNIVKAVERVESIETGTAETPDNIVLRKLLRGSRYFNLQDGNWETCYNCGEEGHMAVNCTLKKRKKPCFVCGDLDHSAKNCTQGKECFICKRRGHRAKDCPEKTIGTSQNSKMCLRCGDFGHDIFSCRNDYASDDLKEIQCYICKSFGHLCCVDYVDTNPREVSCYNCGQSGHTGLGCAKSRRETNSIGSPNLCYRCGEEGHFARECTNASKSNRKMGGSSTPTQRFSEDGRDSLGFRSAPYDLNNAHKKKKTQYEEREFVTEGKRNQRGGWITDDRRDLPYGKAKVNGWSSPTTPIMRSHNFSPLMAGHYSSSQSPGYLPFPVTPSTHGSAMGYQHRYSPSRFSNYGGRGMKRNYEW